MFPLPTVASGAFFGSDWQPERFIHQNHLAEGYAGHRGYVSFREGNIPSRFQNLDPFPLFSLLSIFFLVISGIPTTWELQYNLGNHIVT